MTATSHRTFGVAVVVLIGLVAGIYLAFGIATAQETLGCDFLAYRSAAERFLAQQPIYDLSVTKTGGCNQFQYPPPFVLLALPFALLGPVLGNVAWMAFLVACFVVGCSILPVRPEVRLAIFLIGAISWPFIFGVRIGQVAPILFALFAVGWRWLDRPIVSGIAVGLGVVLKLQPMIVLGWFAVRREWLAVAAGLAVVGTVTVISALIGLAAWADMLTLLRNLSDAIDIPANVSIGAMGYQHGLGLAGASILQTIGIVAVVALVVVCGLKSSREAGYLVAVVASQVVSPIMWTHYALILLLPVAWLLQRRQWWAAAIPLSQAWILLPFMPIEIYPVGFYLALVVIPLVDWRSRRAPAAVPA